MSVEQKLLRPVCQALKIQVHKFSLSLALLMPATQATTVKQFGTKSSFVYTFVKLNQGNKESSVQHFGCFLVMQKPFLVLFCLYVWV